MLATLAPAVRGYTEYTSTSLIDVKSLISAAVLHASAVLGYSSTPVLDLHLLHMHASGEWPPAYLPQCCHNAPALLHWNALPLVDGLADRSLAHRCGSPSAFRTSTSKRRRIHRYPGSHHSSAVRTRRSKLAEASCAERESFSMPGHRSIIRARVLRHAKPHWCA